MSMAIKRAKIFILGFLLTASVFLFGVLSAFGDSYSVNVVAYTQSESFAGIDVAGDFVVNVTNSLMYSGGPCGGVLKASSCFETYYAGQQNPVFSTALPGLDWDNGVSCTKGTALLSGVCNSGHRLLGGFLDDVKGVWVGTNSLTEIVAGGSYDGGYMNSLGDAVFIDGSHDTLVSVVDTPSVQELSVHQLTVGPQPVPEPASLWLVGLGLMASAMLVRRRGYSQLAAKSFRK